MTHSAEKPRKSGSPATGEARGFMTFDRKPGQRIAVDMGSGLLGWITVTPLGEAGTTRVHLDFPRSVRLDREEVFHQRRAREESNGNTD